jgi:hypothetical protein
VGRFFYLRYFENNDKIDKLIFYTLNFTFLNSYLMRWNWLFNEQVYGTFVKIISLDSTMAGEHKEYAEH